MSLISIPASAWERGLDPQAIAWHVGVHVLGIVGGAYLVLFFNPYTAGLMTALFILGHLSIRTGAHSLYTHQAYEAAYIWHVYKVLCFLLTMQGPLTFWASLHIRHHRDTDGPNDPYSPTHGFLWAHMLWLGFKLPKFNAREAKWLIRSETSEGKRIIRLIAWQNRHAWWAGLTVAIALPTGIASIWGDALGGFLVGSTRLLLQYHLTWQINSFGHMVGSRPYSPDSSRDAPWWLSPFTGAFSVGEATRHNRHHRFPRDFRIGNRWYDIEPGKWELYIAWGGSQVFKAVGIPPLVWDLHRYDDDGTLRLLP